MSAAISGFSVILCLAPVCLQPYRDSLSVWGLEWLRCLAVLFSLGALSPQRLSSYIDLQRRSPLLNRCCDGSCPSCCKGIVLVHVLVMVYL